jgi:hypothetical protein
MSPSTPLQLYERGPSWFEYVPPVLALFLVLSLAYFTLLFDVAGVSAWFGVVYRESKASASGLDPEGEADT